MTQIFCSALSVAYSSAPVDAWEPLATLVLDAMCAKMDTLLIGTGPQREMVKWERAAWKMG